MESMELAVNGPLYFVWFLGTDSKQNIDNYRGCMLYAPYMIKCKNVIWSTVTYSDENSRYTMTSSKGNIFALLAFVQGIHRSGEFSSQMPVTGSFDVSLICAWTNGWTNNRDAGDVRHHRTHYDVNIMSWQIEPHKCYALTFKVRAPSVPGKM